MCDEFTGFLGTAPDAAGADSLRRIARVLGVPLAAFYGPDAQGGTGADLVQAETDRLLALVRAHFTRASPEERRVFAEAVQGLAEKA